MKMRKRERNGFWKTEKKCRICGMEEGRIEHIMSHTRIKIRLGFRRKREEGSSEMDERG